ILVFKDVTEQLVGDARLKLQAEQYRALFETNPSPMWIFEVTNLQILAVNQAAIKTYGYSRDEFLRLTMRDLRRRGGDSPVVAGAESGSAPTDFNGQFRHMRKDRSHLFVEIYSAGIVWE